MLKTDKKRRNNEHSIGQRSASSAKRMTAATQKANRGPGGWRCRCCRIGTRSWMKVHMARSERRSVRQSIDAETQTET